MRPRAHVHGLLLAPHNLRVGVPPQLPVHEIPRERRELLDANDLDVCLGAHRLALGVQLVVHLAGAENHALGAGFDARVNLVPGLGGLVHDQALEPDALLRLRRLLVVEVRQRGDALGVPQEVLRGDDDEGLAELAVHLPAEQVEVVRRGGDVANLPVCLLDLGPGVQRHVRRDLVRGLVRHLEVSLHAAARVLRSLAVVAVRK